MIISMEISATGEQIDHVLRRIKELRFPEPKVVKGAERTTINVIGVGKPEKLAGAVQSLEVCDGVEKVVPITKKYKRVSRDMKSAKTVVHVNDHTTVGGDKFAVIAGPCSVESRRQLTKVAEHVARGGATMLRGGAVKPRTSPDEFEGMGEEGLKLLTEAYSRFGLPIVTEVVDPRDVDLTSKYAHVLQIGSRNMQNNRLLDEVGKTRMPVLLKRHFAATVEEWLLAAERIAKGGNENIILCERGIRTCTEVTRFTLDIGAVVAAKRLTHLPIIIDPSHAAGYREYVSDLACAAVAVGADGIIVEVHNNPEKALSDGRQSLDLHMFSHMMDSINPLLAIWAKRR